LQLSQILMPAYLNNFALGVRQLEFCLAAK
jgi:hypothetical protein